MILIRVSDGGTPPRGYGLAYREFDSRSTMAAPIPLNWLIGWGRALGLYLTAGPSPKVEEAFRNRIITEERERVDIILRAKVNVEKRRWVQLGLSLYSRRMREEIRKRNKQRNEEER